MSESPRVTLKRKAGVLIPFMIMPDGKEIDVGPGDIVNDPAAMAVKFEKWLDAWLSEVAENNEPMTMEDLAEVDYRGRVDLGPLGCAE